jgi:hypothetical protein
MKFILNKWQIIFDWGEDSVYLDRFHRLLLMGIIKIREFPAEGEKLQKRHFKGFLWEIRLIIPLFVGRIK